MVQDQVSVVVVEETEEQQIVELSQLDLEWIGGGSLPVDLGL